MNVLRGGGDWLDRTLRIPRRPPGLAPPPDEVPAPQIVERQAAQDIERFASQQVAEAEATEGFASAAEVAAAGAETAAAVETGGALTALGEGALAVAGAAGAATGGLVAAGGAAAVVGTAWAIEGSQRGLPHAGLGRGDGRRHGQRRLAALPSHGRADFERDARIGGGRSLLRAATAPAAAGLPDRHGFRERAAGPASATDPSPPHPAPGPGPAAAHALRHQPGAHPGELGQRPHQWARRARHAPSRSRPSTPFVRRANLKLPNV